MKNKKTKLMEWMLLSIASSTFWIVAVYASRNGNKTVVFFAGTSYEILIKNPIALGVFFGLLLLGKLFYIKTLATAPFNMARFLYWFRQHLGWEKDTNVKLLMDFFFDIAHFIYGVRGRMYLRAFLFNLHYVIWKAWIKNRK